LPELISELIAEGRARVSVLPTSEEWFGVTYREDRKIVQDKIIKLIEKGVYPKELWK
jgi:hypothetical protein